MNYPEKAAYLVCWHDTARKKWKKRKAENENCLRNDILDTRKNYNKIKALA